MSFFYPGWTYIKPVEAVKPVEESYFGPGCTCGAKKASEPYPAPGHADYCDINNPPPETEELPF